MDTDYLLLCPVCDKVVFAKGTGDLEDIVECKVCNNKFTVSEFKTLDSKIQLSTNNNRISRFYLNGKSFN